MMTYQERRPIMMISITVVVVMTMMVTTSITNAFPLLTPQTQKQLTLKMSNANDDNINSNENLSRRNMIVSSMSTLSVLPFLLTQPQIASAAVSGTNKVNAKLKSFGIAPASNSIPDGYVPILEIYGKGKNRSPLLVTFIHPISWVVTLPSQTINGEDGTIQVGDYGKGDTASLFIDDSISGGSGNDITKDMISSGLQKCISQRGSNMYQNFKLVSVKDGPTTSTEDGQVYKIAEFKYQLLTGAGFEVDRKGIASITMSSSNNKQLEIFWAASVDARYKKTAETLQNIVTSFRCYSSGLNFAEEVLS